MGMPIAVDPDIWAFAVDQMEMPDAHTLVWESGSPKLASIKVNASETAALCLWVWSCAS